MSVSLLDVPASALPAAVSSGARGEGFPGPVPVTESESPRAASRSFSEMTTGRLPSFSVWARRSRSFRATSASDCPLEETAPRRQTARIAAADLPMAPFSSPGTSGAKGRPRFFNAPRNCGILLGPVSLPTFRRRVMPLMPWLPLFEADSEIVTS